MYRARNLPPLPTNFADMMIPEILTQTTRETTFIQFFDRENGMLILSSNEQIRAFNMCPMLFMDGTFKTCPNLWSQLYLIKGQIQDNENILLAAILLTSKSHETYKLMFRKIKSLVMEKTGRALAPSIIMSDFESGLIPAVQDEFPDAAHKGCFFHYTQSLYRFVQVSNLLG